MSLGLDDLHIPEPNPRSSETRNEPAGLLTRSRPTAFPARRQWRQIVSDETEPHSSGTVTLFNISAQTFIQQQTPDHLIGKVMSFVSVIAVCTLPIGQAMYGFLFEAFKERIFLVVLFAAVMGLVIALAVRHILRRVPSPQAMD